MEIWWHDSHWVALWVLVAWCFSTMASAVKMNINIWSRLQVFPSINGLNNSYSTITLTHWGRVKHICVSRLTIIGSDNGLSPGRRQAIIWTNVGTLFIEPLGTNFSEILIENLTFHSRICVWKCRLRNGGHFVSVSMCYNVADCNHKQTTQTCIKPCTQTLPS